MTEKQKHCNIGDKLYWRCGIGGKVVCGIIKEIHFCDGYNVYDAYPKDDVIIHFYSDDFGVLAFFTEEEARKTRKR